MRYHTILPLSALAAFSLFSLFTTMQLIPAGEALLASLQQLLLGDQASSAQPFSISLRSALLLLLIILLESIVYLGFYFPGQFFAVVIVVLAEPDLGDMVLLTLIMVAAATLGSAINYGLGYYGLGRRADLQSEDFSLRNLLLAMIHTNALAFYMLSQGARRHRFEVVWLAGLINLPYYLLLIAGTHFLSNQVLYVAETPAVLLGLILTWLVIALLLDGRAWRRRRRLARSTPDPD